MDLPIGIRRVKQILSSKSHLKYKKMINAPMMTMRHREKRLKWGRRFMEKGDIFWNKFIFSDEKKFNRDEPD